MPATTTATKEDVRELEARFDARFQAVSARFVRYDNQFTGTDSRLCEAERRHTDLATHVSTRFEIIDAAIDAANAKLDKLYQQIYTVEARYDLVARRSDQVGRRVIVAVLASTTLLAVLWAVTTVLLLTNHR